MKKIGIVGGLSPESTILYYKTIVDEYKRIKGDEKYPDIIIYSVNFGLFTEYVEKGMDREAADIIVEAIKALHRAGADFVVISANTPHMFYDYIASKSPIPLINIIDALAEQAIKDGVKVIGLLGTKYTLTKGFYVDRLAEHGIKAVVPEPPDIETVNNIIYNELVKGIIRDESRRTLIGIIKRLKEKGVEAVALACTELPLLLTGSVDNVKLYDTARIHALKALYEALKD